MLIDKRWAFTHFLHMATVQFKPSDAGSDLELWQRLSRIAFSGIAVAFLSLQALRFLSFPTLGSVLVNQSS